MPAFVVDIEADNLLDDITKIHCLSYSPVSKLEVKSLTSYEDILEFMAQDDLTIIGHKFVTYDHPALEKILGKKFTCRLVDSLGVSYYLNSSNGRTKHGLEQYGEEQGIAKPKVDDWQNLTVEEYVHRCEEDVKINWHVWKEQQSYLMELYEKDAKEVFRLLDYITFKYDCIREQDENRIPVDIDLLVSELTRLEILVDEKRLALLGVMPQIVKYKKLTKPAKMVKADGTQSEAGRKWVQKLKENGLDEDSEIVELEVVDYTEEANPDSTKQVKDWLYSFGWIPRHIKFDRNKKTNEVKQIPQITSEADKTMICESILELAEEVPEVKYLAGYSTVKHRANILKGFIRDMDKDLKLVGDAMGFTNTFRLKHRVLVNLPKPSAPFAENIRACLIAGEDHYMVGTDLKGIEDNTKQHYIFPFDEEYVKSMRTEGYDAHSEIAIKADIMTREEADFYALVDGTEDKSIFSKEDMSRFKDIKNKRANGKTTNFAATYSCGANTLARNLKKSVSFAKKVLDAYWEVNKSLREFAKTCKTKTVRGQLWVQQPVSGFWYTLRNMKDIFSTVNQGTAVYVFDTWVKHMRNLGLKFNFQAHDEEMTIQHVSIPQEEVKNKILKAMELTNKELSLNVDISCSIDFGLNYKEVH